MEGSIDIRLTEPLYTLPQLALYLRVPSGTLREWVRGGSRSGSRPLISSVTSDRHREAEIPFAGLAEGLVLTALRRPFRNHNPLSMQYIRKAVDVLEREMKVEHALASRRLYSDGAAILYDYAKKDDDIKVLVEVVSQNRVFGEVVQKYLELITYDHSGWASKVALPLTERRVVEADPDRAFGRPIFIRGAARMEDVLARIRAGDELFDVADDFGVPPEDILELLRAFIPEAA